MLVVVVDEGTMSVLGSLFFNKFVSITVDGVLGCCCCCCCKVMDVIDMAVVVSVEEGVNGENVCCSFKGETSVSIRWTACLMYRFFRGTKSNKKDKKWS